MESDEKQHNDHPSEGVIITSFQIDGDGQGQG